MNWLWGQDLNLRPSGYEPDELPDCSTPRQDKIILLMNFSQITNHFKILFHLSISLFLNDLANQKVQVH